MTAVLFTCAGQRVDIVTAFREAGATTVAADVDQLAPALYHADHRAIVPRVDDPFYVEALRNLVELHEVRLIVPLTDLDHLVLAQARESLGGAVVLVPGIETIERCSDKYRAHTFFEEQGIGTPPTWLPTEPHPNDCDCIDCIEDDLRESEEFAKGIDATLDIIPTLDEAIAQRAQAAGAAGFLKKPFYPADVDALFDKIYATPGR